MQLRMRGSGFRSLGAKLLPMQIDSAHDTSFPTSGSDIGILPSPLSLATTVRTTSVPGSATVVWYIR